MSDEPKKRRRKWVWRAAAVVALFLAYPLSYGPAIWISNHGSYEAQSAVADFYRPVERGTDAIGMGQVLWAYLRLFLAHPPGD